MSELINSAIAKITDEAMVLNHTFATFIEEHLTDICKTEQIARKILCEEKSLKAFLSFVENEMRKEAQKKGEGRQSAGLSDISAYERAEQYYNITDEDKSARKTHAQQSMIDIMDFMV